MRIPEGEIDFIGVGEILVDFISREETDWLYNAFTFRKYQGGSPANIAVNISKLGGTASIIAKTGAGAMARFLKMELQRAGVVCDHFVMDHRVNTSVVFVSRTAKTADSEAFRSGDYQLEPDEVKEQAIRQARVVHTSTWALSREPCRSAVRKAFDIAVKHEKIISFDPNYNPAIWPEYREAHKVIDEMLDHATLVKASKDDAVRLFGREKSPEQYIKRFHSYGPKIVVYTMAEKGVLISANGDIIHVPGRPVKVIDATGAGDSFWAGFLVALLDGNSLERSAYFAREIVERKLQTIGPLPDEIDRKEIYDLVDRAQCTPQEPPK